MTIALGFDARAAFLDPYRGLGRVTRELATALLARNELDVSIFLPSGAEAPPSWYRDAAAIVELQRPRRGAFLSDPLSWRLTLAAHPVDCLHLPAWGVPPCLGPTVVIATVHDAIPLRFPGTITAPWTRWRAFRSLYSLRRATRLHANSAHTAAEAVSWLGALAERIDVGLLGVDHQRFCPAQSDPGGEHLLFLGGADPHKGLERLLLAYSVAASSTPPLVVAGSAASSGLAHRYRKLERVSWRPALEDHEIVDLMHRAVALVMPSTSEGFGLPAAEAMACGCPLVLARAGALPEVAGEAAVWVDPDAQPGAWLVAAEQAAQQRVSLREAGIARAAQLTWSATAESLIETYRKALS